MSIFWLHRIRRAARVKTDTTPNAPFAVFLDAGRAAKIEIGVDPETPIRTRVLAAMEALANERIDKVQAGLATVSLIATIMPLLAIFGAVLQMMEGVTWLMRTKSSNIIFLFGEIVVALYTISIALAIGIPAAFLSRFLTIRLTVASRELLRRLESAATSILSSHPAIARPPPLKTKNDVD